MKKAVLLYGLCGGLSIAALRLVEYRFLVLEHSIEIYGGLVAGLFATVGIWLGLSLTKRPEIVVVREVQVPAPVAFVRNDARVSDLGISCARVGLRSQRPSHTRGRRQACRMPLSEGTC